ncbi:mediator of RNA polymerase II transcription subunit 15a-like [Camellia sinensis]|uniref:mediator of RNA polymerase II transcription subunit 15a-like n=1 Tax=Camellia sinensis TaxID=4442 RepID=UPI001036902E|nr:mediator of RNA polymerase II transcription subunit 15a-like [Camellia sinensis]
MPGKNINHLEMNSSKLQNKCLKQLNEPQMIKAQQAKQQFQQRQMTKQLMQNKEHIELQHHRQPAMLLAQQSPQLYQMNEVNSMKVRQGMGVKAGNCLQHHSVGKLSVNNPCFVKPEALSPMSLPQLLQTASPQIPQHCSPLSDQKILQTSFRNSGNRLQSSNSMSVAPPSTSLGPLPIKGDFNRLTSVVSSITNSANNELKETSDALALDTSFVISTPGLSPSLLLAESDLDQNHNHVSTTEFCEPSVTEEPIQQLIKVVRSMSYEALSSSVSDMESIVRMVERTAGSIPGNGSRSAVGEDLVPVTNFRLQGAKLDGNSMTMKMRRYARAMPSNTVASGCITDSCKQFTDPKTCDESSTATLHNKRPRVEVNWTLLKEIREINQQLIDTVVDISEVNSTGATSVTEGDEGTIVKCSFNAITINPNMKTEPASAPVSPILPLRLLVPRNYPACSPVLLDKLPAEVSTGSEDLSVKAKSKLSIILRNVLQPMSLGEIAKNWDVCARAVISEYAEQNGGGTFSSRYGTWKNYLGAA